MKSKNELQNMIEVTGSLLGQSATMFGGKTIMETKGYNPPTPFGKWLKSIVDENIERIHIQQSKKSSAERNCCLPRREKEAAKSDKLAV